MSPPTIKKTRRGGMGFRNWAVGKDEPAANVKKENSIEKEMKKDFKVRPPHRRKPSVCVCVCESVHMLSGHLVGEMRNYFLLCLLLISSHPNPHFPSAYSFHYSLRISCSDI